MPDALLAVILNLILSFLCGVSGLGAGGLIGYYLLRLFRVPAANFTAAKWATIAFGAPTAVVGLIYGYHLGTTILT